jgi:transposase
MSKALSLDLRIRVLAAVHAGATHREAAERFGVSAASVSRWRAREREQGDARAKALGGDRRSGRIEACHAAVLTALGPDRDATIEEVRRDLAAQGLIFGFGTIQRFFARHDITRKKRRRTLRSRIAPTSPRNARNGSRVSSISIPSA